jgi:hypothetical protein
VTAIRINGTRYAFRMPLTEQNRLVDRRQYRIADRWSVESFADRIREAYLFTLDGLSDAERNVLETVIENGSSEIDGDVEDAAESLSDTLQEHRPISQSNDDTLPAATPPYGAPFEVTVWLTRFDGNEYLLQYTEKTDD